VGSNPTRRTDKEAMRSAEEVALVKALSLQGLNHCQIARRTGIPRCTVRDWLVGRVPNTPRLRLNGCSQCGHDLHNPSELPQSDYAYLLGMYLGDGTISHMPRGVFRLRIFQDMRYTGIIQECAQAMKAVMPRNVVDVRQKAPRDLCVEISSYSRAWPCLFPQHGPGRKHERRIVLLDWQQEIVDENPRRLLRGLIHSDGCRVLNKSMGHVYVRYMFSNASSDIRDIFCDTCDQLGIEWRQPKERVISIARRNSIALLDTFVGPKT
jgi:hypothetical protein